LLSSAKKLGFMANSFIFCMGLFNQSIIFYILIRKYCERINGFILSLWLDLKISCEFIGFFCDEKRHLIKNPRLSFQKKGRKHKCKKKIHFFLIHFQNGFNKKLLDNGTRWEKKHFFSYQTHVFCCFLLLRGVNRLRDL